MISPKFEYSSGALNHVNERYQLRRYGDEEVKKKMTISHTDVPSVSPHYLLNSIHKWLQFAIQNEDFSRYLIAIAETETSKLSTFLTALSRRVIILPLPPISLIPMYEKHPFQIIENLLKAMGRETLKQLSIPAGGDATSGNTQENYELLLGMKKALLANGFDELAFEIENVASVKVINALQRLLDHVVIRTNGFPLGELSLDFSTLDGLSWVEKVRNSLNATLRSLDADNEDEVVYLREMNGASLTLEIAENLERSDEIWLTGYSSQMSDNGR